MQHFTRQQGGLDLEPLGLDWLAEVEQFGGAEEQRDRQQEEMEHHIRHLTTLLAAIK